MATPGARSGTRSAVCPAPCVRRRSNDEVRPGPLSCDTAPNVARALTVEMPQELLADSLSPAIRRCPELSFRPGQVTISSGCNSRRRAARPVFEPGQYITRAEFYDPGPNSVHMRTYRMISKHVVHVGQRTSIRMRSMSASSPPRPTDADGDRSPGVQTRLPGASRKWRWTTAFGLAGALHGRGRRSQHAAF